MAAAACHCFSNGSAALNRPGPLAPPEGVVLGLGCGSPPGAMISKVTALATSVGSRQSYLLNRSGATTVYLPGAKDRRTLPKGQHAHTRSPATF